MKMLSGWPIESLLANFYIEQCLNDSRNYKDFRYHWDNYELNISMGFTPTEKQYLTLVDAHKVNDLGPDYHCHWWTKIKRIVKEHQNEKIDGKLVDLFTANYMHQIVTKLNEKNRAKMLAYDFPVALHVMWKIVGKAAE